jgi:hypothetical protein
MTEEALIALLQKELEVLKEFLKSLTRERDAIISFSLEGIVRENNRKEEILRKLEYLEAEKERCLKEVADREAVMKSPALESVRPDIRRTMDAVSTAMERNMKLLSFSMDNVKSSMDSIIRFINTATYGKKKEKISVLLSRNV